MVYCFDNRRGGNVSMYIVSNNRRGGKSIRICCRRQYIVEVGYRYIWSVTLDDGRYLSIDNASENRLGRCLSIDVVGNRLLILWVGRCCPAQSIVKRAQRWPSPQTVGRKTCVSIAIVDRNKNCAIHSWIAMGHRKRLCKHLSMAFSIQSRLVKTTIDRYYRRQ